MKRAVYDIEGNGLLIPLYDKKNDVLLPACDTIWCVVIHDYQTGEVFKYRPHQMVEAYIKLQQYDLLIGHNVYGYDRPALEHLVGEPNNLGSLPLHGDTLVMSRLLYGRDTAPTPDGYHSLESWGKFLGVGKTEFSDWSKFTEKMLEYCAQDVNVSVELYNFLMPKMTDNLNQAYSCECAVLETITMQCFEGMCLDLDNYNELIQKLEIGFAEARDLLDKLFPPRIEVMKTPQYYYDPDTGNHYNKKKDAPPFIYKRLVAGPMREKIHPFNPNSAPQLIEFLTKEKGWRPTKFTDAGNPSTEAEVLEKLPYPEMEVILDYRLLDKRLSQCRSWLKCLTDEGKIHGHVNTMGASTYRMTHSDPNLAQIPAAYSPYGPECRACWIPPPGMMMTGTDAKGLENRCLANALEPFDGGAFIERILHGDIHTDNMKLLGLDVLNTESEPEAGRNQAKTVIYAFNYSAGLLKLGTLCRDSVSLQEEAETIQLNPLYIKYLRENNWDTPEFRTLAQIGTCVRRRLYTHIEGLSDLIEALKMENQQYGYIKGIDGRRIYVDVEYSILNRRLQSDGGIIMKYGLLNHRYAVENVLGKHGKHWAYMVNVHDEWQCWHPPVVFDFMQDAGNKAIEQVTYDLNLVCPLAGDSSSGYSWRDTH